MNYQLYEFYLKFFFYYFHDQDHILIVDLKTIEKLDGRRKPERYEQFLIACTADARGRSGFENTAYPQADYYRTALKLIKSVDIKALHDQGFKGQEMAQAIHKARLSTLKQNLPNTLG